MSKEKPVVAVLDDEPQMRKALRRLLSSHGIEVNDYARAEELLDAVTACPADCLVLDLHMPGLNGFDVLTAIASRRVPMPVITITGHDTPDTRERVLTLGAAAYLLKPVDESALLDAIRAAM